MIYLLYGEEKFELYDFVNKIKKQYERLEQGINYFNITKENLDELGDNIYNSVTFFGDSKLVIIKDTSLKFDADTLIKNSQDTDNYVIIEDSIDKRTVSYKVLSKKAEIHEFKHLSEADMASYIINLFRRYGFFVSRDNAVYMINICGLDKNNIINEIQKLTIYLNKGDEVTKGAIEKICSKTFEAKIFDMLEEAVNKKSKEAIKSLDELILAKEPPIKVAVMLYKDIKSMYEIKCLRKNGNNNPNETLKISPFRYSKLAKASEKYSIDDLEKLIIKFNKYDEGIKNGEMDMEIGLKEIICMM